MSGLSPPHLRPGRGEPSLEHCQVLQSRQRGEEVRKFARKARSFRAAPRDGASNAHADIEKHVAERKAQGASQHYRQ